MPYNEALGWFERQTMKLVGAGTPAEQIVASIVLGVLLIASSSVGLVFTLLLLWIPALTLMIGVLRLAPPVDAAYPV
jgi:hypothetical protein